MSSLNMFVDAIIENHRRYDKLFRAHYVKITILSTDVHAIHPEDHEIGLSREAQRSHHGGAISYHASAKFRLRH
jgi:hypothetical protein